MGRRNQCIDMHLLHIALVGLLTVLCIVQGLQEREDGNRTVSLPDDSSTSSHEHSSSELHSSEEMYANDTVSTTPISINSTRINRNINGDSSSSSTESTESTSSEEMYSSTETISVTLASVNRTLESTTSWTSSATNATAVTSSPINVTSSESQSSPLKQLSSECEESHLKSDKCLQDALFVGQTSAMIPKIESEMDAYCVVKKQDFNCIKEFGTKCLKNVPRQIYLTITKNVRKMFKEFCDTSTGKKTFLNHLECAKPEHLKILNEVLGRLTLSLDFVANNVSRDEMIFHACCTLQDTYVKIPIVMGNMCSPKETPIETIDFFRSLIRRTVGDIVDIGCGKYSSLAYCEENLPHGMTAMRNYANDANRPLPAMSFMSPLMQFAQKLDGQQ